MAETFEAGGLTFAVEHRAFGQDGGPALMIYGEVEGRRRQLLRFDCFRADPHYHYDPDGTNATTHLTGMGVPESVAFTIDAVRGKLPELLRTAGFAALADEVDQPAVAEAASRLATALTGQGG